MKRAWMMVSLGVLLAACKVTPADTGGGGGAQGGDGGGGASGGSGGGGASALPSAALRSLCCRDPLEWMRDPQNWHPEPNYSCPVNAPSGVCFGQTLYEVSTAFAVSYDPDAPPFKGFELKDGLVGLYEQALAGQPAGVPGCSGPASCATVYDPAWNPVVAELLVELHSYVNPESHAAWQQAVSALGAPEWPAESPSEPAKAVRARLDEGLPSIVLLQQPKWKEVRHAIAIVDLAFQDDGTVAVDFYDANLKKGAPFVKTMTCKADFTGCATKLYKNIDHDRDPSTPPEDFQYIVEGKLQFSLEGARYNDYVDFLDWRRDQICADYLGGIGVAPALTMEYMHTTTVWDDGGEPKSVKGINKHRFVLDEPGEHVVEQTARQTIFAEDGTHIVQLSVWTKATNMIDAYALEPTVPHPLSGAPMVVKQPSTPATDLIWVFPIMPGLNDILLGCMDEDLDACLGKDGATPLGDENVKGVPCRDYKMKEVNGVGYNLCVANRPCEEGGLLLPVRMQFFQAGALRSEVVLEDIWSPELPPETFAVPTDCAPFQGSPVEFCTPP